MDMTNQAQTAESAAASLAGIKRNPTFDEMEPAAQIQSLRRELRIQRELANSQQMLIERLMRHEHKGDGTMMVPMAASGHGDGRLAGYRHDPLA